LKRIHLFAFTGVIIILSCNNLKTNETKIDSDDTIQVKQDSTSGYAHVNGLEMYYEIHGIEHPIAGSLTNGEERIPLVLIHGGGSTIQTTFGRVLDDFAKTRKIIAVELQGHGHTPFINRPETFEQDADDVAALMKFLKIENSDFFGFSNGGNTTMQIAIRHPELVRKIIIGSAFFKRDGMYPQF